MRAELWILLRDSLLRFLRCHAAHGYRAAREDLEDIASAKALELLRRAESGEWSPGGRSPREVAGYVAAAARNGLLDLSRRNGRMEPIEPEQIDMSPAVQSWLARPEPPGALAEAEEFVGALQGCLEQLDARRRRVWFLRVFHEMSSREIAAHPEVRMTSAHVDVVAQRARDALRNCLVSRGFEPRELSSLAFVAIWDWLETLPDARIPVEEDAPHER